MHIRSPFVEWICRSNFSKTYKPYFYMGMYFYFLLANTENVSLSLPCTGRDTGCLGGIISYFHLYLYIESVLNSTHKSMLSIFLPTTLS